MKHDHKLTYINQHQEHAIMFKVVEKANPLAVHAICDSRDRAQYWIDVKAPEYCARGYFSDKTLTADSFTILEA